MRGSDRVQICCVYNLFILTCSCSFASMVVILGSSGGAVASAGGGLPKCLIIILCLFFLAEVRDGQLLGCCVHHIGSIREHMGKDSRDIRGMEYT